MRNVEYQLLGGFNLESVRRSFFIATSELENIVNAKTRLSHEALGELQEILSRVPDEKLALEKGKFRTLLEKSF